MIMMNLIERLGGYDNAKKLRGTTSNALLDMKTWEVHVDDIDSALLKYRRANNIFEVGDKVVLAGGTCTLMYEVVEKIGSELIVKRPSGREFEFTLYHINHAADEEIEAGRRL